MKKIPEFVKGNSEEVAVRELSEEVVAGLKKNAQSYVERGKLHSQQLKRID